MKKKTPMLIAYGVLAICTVIVMLMNFSVSMAIAAAAVLGVVAWAFFIGNNHSMVKDLPWFAAALVFVFVVMPQGVTLDNLGMGAAELSDAVGEALEDSPLFVFAFIAMLALFLFFRNRTGLVWMILRYVSEFLFLNQLGKALTGNFECYLGVLIGLTLLCLGYELRGRQESLFRKRTSCLLLCGLGYYLVYAGWGELTAWKIAEIFNMSQVGWLIPTIAVAVVGLLLIMEEYNNRERFGETDIVDDKVGWVFLFWSLLSLVMHIWTATLNYLALMVLPVVLYLLYSSFFSGGNTFLKFKEKNVFPAAWGIFTVILLVVGKSLNQIPLVGLVLIVLLLAAYILWRIVEKNSGNGLIMKGYLGISAAALLGSTVVAKATDDPVKVAMILVSAVLGGVTWCLISGSADKVHKKASDIYPLEYTAVANWNVVAPIVVLAVALVRILFVL